MKSMKSMKDKKQRQKQNLEFPFFFSPSRSSCSSWLTHFRLRFRSLSPNAGLYLVTAKKASEVMFLTAGSLATAGAKVGHLPVWRR